jgi:YggT family protein
VAWLIFGVTLALVTLLLLRILVNWIGSNPFAWVPYNLKRVTEPLVRPLRQPFVGQYMRFDLLPLVAAALILFTGLFTSDMIWRISGLLGVLFYTIEYSLVTQGFLLAWFITVLGTLYEAAIFVRILLPWFGVGYGSRLLRFLFKITEPVLRPIRRLLSRFLSVSMFDFTPIIALLLVRFITGILADLARELVR